MSDSAKPGWPLRRRWWVQAAAAVVLLALGVGAAFTLFSSAPHAARQPAPKPARLVETVTVQAGEHRAPVAAMGRVLAARESTLYPEVAGRIVAVNERFVPGGRVREGEELLRLDPADYRLAVRQRESAVAKAAAALAQERGQQQVAKREYELLGETLSDSERALVLRQPQLESAEAALAEARAALEQARLELARTVVKAPYDGIITEKRVDLGTRVTTGTALVELVAVDRFWVRLDLPVEDVRRLVVPDSSTETGSSVSLRRTDWPPGVVRHGRVVQLVPRLEDVSRLAQVLVEVDDPLARDPANGPLPPLLINDYVEATVEGRTLTGVVALERALLRGGERVWLYEDGRLAVRPVEVVYRGADRVFIAAGLDSGDRVVSTDLATPVPGMALRTEDEGAAGRGERDDG